MKVNAINSTSFTGKYQLNANQTMPNQETCLKRDALMGFWASYSKDGDKITKTLKDYFNSPEYDSNRYKEVPVTFEIPDNYDSEFENL